MIDEVPNQKDFEIEKQDRIEKVKAKILKKEDSYELYPIHVEFLERFVFPFSNFL